MPNLAKFFLGALLGVGAAAGAASGGHRTVSVFDQLHQNDLIIKTPDGQRLYLTSLGKGPPVLVIAGGPGMNYEYLVDAFVGLSKSHKVIFLEQRGNLLSPAAPDKVSFDKAVDDIEFARKALSLGPLTLAAHSTGTRTAVGYYSKHPRTVAKLILIGSFPPFVDKDWQPSNMAEKLSTRPQVTQLVERLGLNLEDDLKTHKIKIEDVTPQMASDYWRIKFAAANIYHIERWRQVEGGRIFYNEATAAEVSRTAPAAYDIRVPLAEHPASIYVLQGDSDFVDPAASSWRSAQEQDLGLRRCSVVRIFKWAGHDVWIDSPSPFDAALRRAVDAPPLC